MFDYARPEVRSFLLSSAHVLDRDVPRRRPARRRGREHPLRGPCTPARAKDAARASRSCGSSRARSKRQHPASGLSAEDSSAWPGSTRPAPAGGLGFDLKWDMGFSHDMRRYLAIDPVHRSQQQGILTFRSVYARTESFVLPLSHDDVTEERGGSLLAQMHGDDVAEAREPALLYSLDVGPAGQEAALHGRRVRAAERLASRPEPRLARGAASRGMRGSRGWSAT